MTGTIGCVPPTALLPVLFGGERRGEGWQVAGHGEIPPGALGASRELRGAFEAVLRRAQDAGQVRREVTVDEVYLLVRSLAQASAAMPVPRDTLRRAAEIILAGLASPASG